MDDTRLTDRFCWGDPATLPKDISPAEEYQAIARWAGRARGQNPNAFDALTAWLLDDSQWSSEQLPANEKLLQEILGRFRRQNAWLRQRLTQLKPTGVVNLPVFQALDRFDHELEKASYGPEVQQAVEQMAADFSVMASRDVRKQIAGDKTGPCGTDSVDIFGYINQLKDCDASVQWTLFMPYVVADQQKGFHVSSFEYRKTPAMRFIGREETGHDNLDDLFATLDTLSAYCSDLTFDAYLYHHHGRGVDVDSGAGLWGRFMRPDTPVPDGFVALDFLPEYTGDAGLPYLSQFAYAVFEGSHDAMHENKGFDVDAMYDITRNIMLSQNVPIPYPEKYWTAGVFLNGYKESSTAYMFSALL